MITYYVFSTLLCCAVLVAQSCPTLYNLTDCSSPASSVHEYSPGKNSGVGCHALLQGNFPTQGSNQVSHIAEGLPHCRQILYHLRHQGSPRILEWVAYPSSRGSSWPRNQTGVSCIAGRFVTSWATKEAPAHFEPPGKPAMKDTKIYKHKIPITETLIFSICPF